MEMLPPLVRPRGLRGPVVRHVRLRERDPHLLRGPLMRRPARKTMSKLSSSGPTAFCDVSGNPADQPTMFQWVEYEMPRDMTAIRMVVPATGPELSYAMFSQYASPSVCLAS
eukprot:1150681-Pyramimonas_sp.AAC.1